MKQLGGLGRLARTRIVAFVFIPTFGSSQFVIADGQDAGAPEISTQREVSREPMTIEQAKSMAEGMLEGIVAARHPTGSPQVIGVPSVVPTGNCVDGVCLDVVRSVQEYLSSQPAGVHRFQFMTIVGDNNVTLFAVITGGTMRNKSPSSEQLLRFFNAESSVPLSNELIESVPHGDPPEPMNTEQAKSLAESTLENIVAARHPTGSRQVIGVPSVVPTGNCVDGVCLDVVRSAREYLGSRPKGVHRFQFMTIAGDNNDTLFAVITGGAIQTRSPSDEQIQQFFDTGDHQTAVPEAFCTPEVLGWRLCIIIDDDDPAICVGVCDSEHCYTICYVSAE